MRLSSLSFYDIEQMVEVLKKYADSTMWGDSEYAMEDVFCPTGRQNNEDHGWKLAKDCLDEIEKGQTP